MITFLKAEETRERTTGPVPENPSELMVVDWFPAVVDTIRIVVCVGLMLRLPTRQRSLTPNPEFFSVVAISLAGRKLHKFL
jgi:hypothetical protein